MEKFKELSIEEMQEVEGVLAPLIIWGVTVSWGYIGGCLAAGAALIGALGAETVDKTLVKNLSRRL